ncbi:MAG: hypothetical protein P4L31_05020, partial [Candidatus Babeliales bacterium]|nr:hypothetical protein [Candidatus Babeliales bacterium]
GDIGSFKITEVATPAAGLRRIFAVTGAGATQLFQETFDIVRTLGQEFKVQRDQVLEHVAKQKETIKELNTEIRQLKQQVFKAQVPTWIAQTVTVGKVPYLFLALNDLSAEDLREAASHLIAKQHGFNFLISKTGDKVNFLCVLSPDLTTTVDLKKFAAWLKDNHQLRGGSTATSLQGGGVKFDAKLKDDIREWLTSNQ